MDSACSSSFSPCASLSKKLSSNIWNFIDIIEILLENNKKEIKAKCKICSKLLSGGSNSGTSHLKSVKPEKFPFLEKGKNRNFDYKIVISVKNL